MSASSLVLASIPSPDRGVWEIDLGFISFPLRAYALCIIAGIVVAIWWGEKRFVARGGAPGTVLDVAVFAVPFGLVGGRLYHVATDYHRYFGEGENPLNALKIWEGGLGIWGAVALGGVGAWIGCKRRGVPLPAFADAVAPGIVVAQAIGRLGNYFNQELYGAPTDLPWGLELYRRINEFGVEDPLNGVAIDHTLIDGSPVHPTFLYELVWNLLVAALVVLADRKLRLGHGRAFSLYVAGYSLGRGWIELMRTDEATLVFGVRVNVWTSVLLFAGGIAYFILARKRGEREDLAAIRAEHEAKNAPKSPDDTKDDSTEGDAAKDETADADNPEAGADKPEAIAGKPEADADKPEAEADKPDADKPADNSEEASAGADKRD